MKILWLSPIFLENRLDGASRIEILKQLSKDNEITFMSLKSKKGVPPPNERLKFLQVPIRASKLFSTLVFSLYLFFFFPLILQLTKPAVLVIESEIFLPSVLTSMPLTKLRRIKTVLDIRSPPVETSGFEGLLQIYSFNVSVRLARHLFNGVSALTSMMLADVCTRFNIVNKPVTFWSSGVSTGLFDPRAYSQRTQLKSQLKIPENAFVLFYHGSLSENRGIIQLITAMSTLQNEVPALILLIVGSGSSEQRIKMLIENYHLNNVILHPAVPYDNVPAYIGVADACIVPLPNHPFWLYQSPLKLLEYMSMEKVVLATDIPAHRAILGDSECAIYIPSAEPQQIAESITYAYRNKASLRIWGYKGREIVAKEYTWEKISQKLDAFFKNNL